MSQPISFGVLNFPYQTLDVVGPIDILGSCSKKLLEECSFPPELCAKGFDITFHHIAPTLDPVLHTANYSSISTTTLKDCPKLDYLLIGGPLHKYIANEFCDEFKNFIRTRLPELKTVFTTCTGGMVLASTGALDGVNATNNNESLPVAREWFPNVKWQKEQWVVDGKFWTAGGAYAGMDMMGEWVRQNCDKEVWETGFKSLDFVPRDRMGVRMDS